jgi:hypothetical protein
MESAWKNKSEKLPNRIKIWKPKDIRVKYILQNFWLARKWHRQCVFHFKGAAGPEIFLLVFFNMDIWIQHEKAIQNQVLVKSKSQYLRILRSIWVIFHFAIYIKSQNRPITFSWVNFGISWGFRGYYYVFLTNKIPQKPNPLKKIKKIERKKFRPFLDPGVVMTSLPISNDQGKISGIASVNLKVYPLGLFSKNFSPLRPPVWAVA